MPNRLGQIGLPLVAVLAIAGGAMAQAPDNKPLNVIDWLDEQTSAAPAPQPSEPDVANSGSVPTVSVAPLNSAAPQRVGLAPANVTGLPDGIWAGSDGAQLARTVRDMPILHLPALQSLYYTLLLAEAAPPRTSADAFDMARIDALMDLGALDPALALVEQTGPDLNRAHFARYTDMALLAGTESRACAIQRAQPTLTPSEAHRVFCTARDGDWQTAVLVLGTARVLGMIPDTTAQALERFLDPDLFEDEPPLAVPAMPDPLLFRLYQAIGTPIPTRIWPLVYANADLSDTAGWKAQIEAAERLARSGALPDNRLLGLYTQRQPAASGGVWDRVAALQRFETALGTRSPAAVAKTLPNAWQQMRRARLAVPFANLFAADLSDIVLSGRTADIAFEVLLLSSQYETAARTFPARALQRPVLAAAASGEVRADLSASGTAGAVLSGFRDAAPDADIIAAAQSGRLGHALFDTLRLMDAGGKGDVAQLSTGLATLRALGLEDVARRAALQVLLLGPQS
ncbi:hypothetical protein [uncultured Tateyamaria sp.]|uniref:hypothetical protein n=1 Tax=uncultured Tateyamaria sp. TaxID=455651 RepID=UPI00261AA831|nr:hypothetical protein [uncultured Tateyamaria sp.]